MTTGWSVLCLLLLLPLCCPASPHQRGVLNFSQSLRLTQKIRACVQGLLPQYKEQQFGDRLYEDHTVLKILPSSLDMKYSQWISMQDWERLSTAPKYLHTFWVHLEIRRQQMKKFWKNRAGENKAKHLIQAMSRIQEHLQDLIGKVTSQLGSLNGASFPQASPSPTPQVLTPPTYLLRTQDLWVSWKGGYIVLRDLEHYLGKLARDFIFLKAKHRGSPAGRIHSHTK
ncbi:uncharacterized protein LOC118235404 [Anguilla anguilla]|uniref:uncharacterized protein LOC118235404 n=1 Tax=Anguilla anguilla TaxID=7936 RepID=UPI0015B1E2EF|nr:uncharacterized protein LOC118235404 [Anguilla anguilla]